MMKTPTDKHVRALVSKAYTDVLQPGIGQKLVKLVDYDKSQVAALPQDAVDNSFGCGDPLSFANVKLGQTVLDLGSGAGIDLLIAAQKVGSTGKVIGVDMTDAMLKKAQMNIDKSGFSNIELKQGIIEALPVDDGSVDWVISNCVINLSPDKPAVFAEIARVLRPSGQLQISDIVVELDALPDSLNDSEILHSACVTGAIDEKSYLAGLAKAGLDNIKVVDRTVYDLATIKWLIKSGEAPELSDYIKSFGDDSDVVLDQLAASIEGKLWSAKISASKATAKRCC